MKRTPLKRKARLRSGSVLPKRTRGRRFPTLADEPYLAWVRGMPCTVAGVRWVRVSPRVAVEQHECRGVIEAHHVRTKGAGGSDRQTVPLCTVAHDEIHRWGRATFAQRYRVDLSGVASALAARYREEHGE